MDVDGRVLNSWILSVGNELLIGRTVNTNAAWLGKRLTFLGFKVDRVVVVPDDVDEIAGEVSRAVSKAYLVVTTGGLGSTYDDVTLEGVAKGLGRNLVLNSRALEMVRSFYSARGLELTSDRVKMAMLPEGAEPLRNPVGAAPGALLRVGGSLVASLPGVPREMESMFTESLEPVLRDVVGGVFVVECGFTVYGVPESSLAPYIREAAFKVPRSYVKSHPRGSEIGEPVLDIRVVASGGSRSEAVRWAFQALDIVRRGVEALGGRIAEEARC